MGVVLHAVVAFARVGHGPGFCTQVLVAALHDQSPAQTVVSSRSHTPSPALHASIVTQFIVGLQNSPLGQPPSSGANTQVFVAVSHVPPMHGTLTHFSGSFVGTQKPPRHCRPLLPAHRFGPVQSEVRTQVCIAPPSTPASCPPSAAVALLLPLVLLLEFEPPVELRVDELWLVPPRRRRA
jgi:hypothetical protein